MPKTKEQKQAIINDLLEKINKQKALILVSFDNLSSPALFDLRRRLKEQRCLLKVIKKTLLEKTFEKLDQRDLLEKIKEIKSQLALVFSFEDEIIPAKICHQFSKQNENLKILGGIMEIKDEKRVYEEQSIKMKDYEFLFAEKVIEISQLPSKNELLIRMILNLQSPVLNFINVLQGNIKGLIYVLAKAKR